MQMNVGAVFDGTFLYFCSYGHSLMIRYDTRRDFADASSWETCPLDVDGGYDGGFFDGRYVYFCPWTRGARAGRKIHHCHFLRYDTTTPFCDPQSWQTRDASATAGLHSVGYNAGAFDGRFFYAAPLLDGEGDKFHGRVLRCDALGTGGTFSLRYGDYGHNGGLCAAVPGPSFVVNTAQGARSIAAHRSLAPGHGGVITPTQGHEGISHDEARLLGEPRIGMALDQAVHKLSLIHISEPTRRYAIS